MKTAERLVREAKGIGNGAHVFVPRSWAGADVILIRRPKKTVMEMVLATVWDNLQSVEGVYLAGSHARDEAAMGSDIDLLIITGETARIRPRPGVQALVVEKDRIKDAIRLNPVAIHSMLREAKPIINRSLLEELRKKYRFTKRDFAEYLSETKSIANINRSLLEGENGSNGLEGQAYSILLRLRGVYIIKCLLAGKLHSNRGFREFVLGNSKVDYGSIYLAYKNVKAGSKLKVKLKASDLIMLLEVLGREAGRLA